jgi:hypothetical protein
VSILEIMIELAKFYLYFLALFSIIPSKYVPFFLRATNVQSKVENNPPHTAKLPPIFGASRRIDCRKYIMVAF